MNTEQMETALNTENTAPATALAVPATQEDGPVAVTKRVYTSKEDMAKGNEAVLATLSTDGEGLSKAQILAALSTEDRALVERNWNLRIALLEETQQVRAKGQKVAKRYFKNA
jgi:hypothetical protein